MRKLLEELLEDTGRNVFRQSDLLDLASTPE
jgi:hypothetical protein